MARVSKYPDKRDEVLRTIASTALQHGKPPSIRDLAEDHDVGVATMHSYLIKLAKEGLIEWRRGKHRSLRCTEQGFQKLSLQGWPSA